MVNDISPPMQPTGINYQNPPNTQDDDEFTTSVHWTRTRTCKVIVVRIGILAGAAACFASAPIVAGILAAASIICLSIPIYQTFFNPSLPKEIEITSKGPELIFIARTIQKALSAINSIPENFSNAFPEQVSDDISTKFYQMKWNTGTIPIPQNKLLNLNNDHNGLTRDQYVFQALAKPKYPGVGGHADHCAMPGYAYHATRIKMSGDSYIAAQGATPETHDSFLQLLNENDAAVSVALINEKELKDTEKHTRIGPAAINKPTTIPERKLRRGGNGDWNISLNAVTVKLIGSVHVPGMNLRVDQLELNGKTHFRINDMGWADGTAANPARLATIAMITEKLRQHPSVADRLDKPIVVNCNAGVGRSGTFITASDDIRHYLNQTDAPDLDTRIQDARSRRTKFVQSTGQYNTLTTLHENLDAILEPLIYSVEGSSRHS